MPGKKHSTANTLSRYPLLTKEGESDSSVDNSDKFIKAQFNPLIIISLSISNEDSNSDQEGEQLLLLNPKSNYSKLHQEVTLYLRSKIRPNRIASRQKWRAFKTYAKRFIVYKYELYREAQKNRPRKRVIDDEITQRAILNRIYNHLGHKGRDSTYRRITIIY
jgi:hypothetical protein